MDRPETATAVDAPSSDLHRDAMHGLLGPEPGDEPGHPTGMDLMVALARALNEAEELKHKAKQLTDRIARLSGPAIRQMAETANPSGTWEGRTIFLRNTFRVKPKEEALESGELARALERYGAEVELLIRQACNAKTLTSYLNERVKTRRSEANDLDTQVAPAAEILPEDLVACLEITEMTEIGHRRATRRTR